MKPFSDSTFFLCTFLQQEPKLLDGYPHPPTIIPTWFQAKNKQRPFTVEPPVYVGPATGEILGRIANWKHDPIFDLPHQDFFTEEQNEALEAYQAEFSEWAAKKGQWEIAQNLIQLRKWIYWLTRYVNMNILDGGAMEFAGLPSSIADDWDDRP